MPTFRKLNNLDHDRVVSFLAKNPMRSFGLASWVLRYSIVEPRTRGTYYGFFDRSENLCGVALIGHFTLFETTSIEVIREIASLVETNDVNHLIISEESTSDLLWRNLPRTRKALYKCCPYALLKMERSGGTSPHSLTLRAAQSADLENVITAHAQAFAAERGVNPLNYESAAFRQRCQDRIDRCQTWIHEQDGELLFKVELMGQTSDFSYIEGVWTNPKYRGLGLGKRCLMAMADRLLVNSKVVCLLADENESKRIAFYNTSGFEKCGRFIARHYAPKIESDKL